MELKDEKPMLLLPIIWLPPIMFDWSMTPKLLLGMLTMLDSIMGWFMLLMLLMLFMELMLFIMLDWPMLFDIPKLELSITGCIDDPELRIICVFMSSFMFIWLMSSVPMSDSSVFIPNPPQFILN